MSEGNNWIEVALVTREVRLLEEFLNDQGGTFSLKQQYAATSDTYRGTKYHVTLMVPVSRFARVHLALRKYFDTVDSKAEIHLESI